MGGSPSESSFSSLDRGFSGRALRQTRLLWKDVGRSLVAVGQGAAGKHLSFSEHTIHLGTLLKMQILTQ